MEQTQPATEKLSENRAPADARSRQPADVSGANESAPSAKAEIPGDMLKCISDLSQSASYAYVLYLSFLAYCTLTILTTTDAQIIRNDTTVLPLINLNVPFSTFFRVAPLIAIGLFIYFELYHSRVTGILNDVRSDYAPLDKRRLYPWLVTLGEQPDPGAVGRLERLVVTFSLWWTLPIVLWLFAFWTLRKHALTDSLFIAVVNLLGVLFVFGFWRRYRPSTRVGRHLVLGVALIAQAGLLGLLVLVIWKGYPGASYVTTSQKLNWVAAVRSYTAVDFRYTSFTDAHNLEGTHFEGAQLEQSDFKGAKLSSVSMRNADLNLADLRETDLSSAVLDGANLTETKLDDSNISSAGFADAFMVNANLTNVTAVAVDFGRALLIGARFYHANLQHSDFQAATLTNADFEGANLDAAQNLTVDQLASACTLYQARIDKRLVDRLATKYPALFQQPRRDAQGICQGGAG